MSPIPTEPVHLVEDAATGDRLLIYGTEKGSRANADHENMGLRAWKGERVTQADADVAKNYLVESEIKELNRLTTILLDIFEDQLDLGRISTMLEVETLLDSQLKSLGRNVWRDSKGGASEGPRSKPVQAIQ